MNFLEICAGRRVGASCEGSKETCEDKNKGKGRECLADSEEEDEAKTIHSSLASWRSGRLGRLRRPMA